VKPFVAMLLPLTALVGCAITTFMLSSVYAAGCVVALGLLFVKPMPAEAVFRWAANWQARTSICLPSVAFDARISYARVAT
jgi:predicted signal transduction protein with EAL and GGDEF domain